jgi:prophage DNA circulation protein
MAVPLPGVHTHLHSKHDDSHHHNEEPIDKNAIVVKGISDYSAFNNESLHMNSKVNKSRSLCSKMGGRMHTKQSAEVLDNTCENGTKKNPTLVNHAQNLQPSKTQIVNKKQRRRKKNGTSKVEMQTTSIDASTNGALGWDKRMQLGANERNNNNMMRSMSEVVEDSHVLVKQSMNPYFDFKHSMMLMIREEHLEVKIVAIHSKFLLTLIDF